MGDAVWDKRAPGPKPGPNRPGSIQSLVRVTDERDGEVVNRMYSYWSSAIERDGFTYAFVGVRDKLPQFFKVEDLSVTRLGSLVPYAGEAEGWSWTLDGEIMLTDGPRIRRVNPFTGTDVVVLDISAAYPGCDLWQSHSSTDGNCHSATVRQIVPEGSYPKLGTIVLRNGKQDYFRAEGILDESHISANGRYLLIEESDDNRIIDLETGEENHIANVDGALSHIDCGPDYAVGEDDQAGACVSLDLRTRERDELFETWNMGHVSVRNGRCIVSDGSQIKRVSLDRSKVVLPLVDHGMTGTAYDNQVFANLSPSGRTVAWVSNNYGRMDLFVMPI